MTETLVPYSGVERSAFTTLTTPIDHVAAPHLLPFLRTHGATVEAVSANQTYLARLPCGKRRVRTFKVYQVTLPSGMRQFDGLTTSSFVPFTLLFPDGAVLRGSINRLTTPAQIVLHLPVESV